MKVFLKMTLLALNLLLCGDTMAEQIHDWITIKDKERDLQVDFPHQPLEMNFEIPFQNTPPRGKIHLYSLPTNAGILVASTFNSPDVNASSLEKDQLYLFFEKHLVPHFFYNPHVFQDQQKFNYDSIQHKGKKAASFQIYFKDHGVLKKLDGLAFVKGKNLYTFFYLATEKDFDEEAFKRFLDSVHFSKSNQN